VETKALGQGLPVRPTGLSTRVLPRLFFLILCHEGGSQAATLARSSSVCVAPSGPGDIGKLMHQRNFDYEEQ